MKTSRRRLGQLFRSAAVAGAVALLSAGCDLGSDQAGIDEPGTQARQAAPADVPALDVRVVMRHLDIPWDIAVLPSGSWLVTERDRLRITLRHPDGSIVVLADHPAGFWASGETGLMSIAADPAVASNGRFYTCNGFDDGTPEIRVEAWKLSADRRSARLLGPLLTGIQTTSGRHGGCRIRFGPGGSMWVGTGDSAVGTNPQDLTSLNGKLLRLNRFTGAPWPSNPWVNAANDSKRYIYNYGHRNVQGLSWRPGDTMWTIEQGTDRDDEVNRAVKGANYGWNPVPGYNEDTPMTDYSLPGRQIGARWRSGYPTIATSGATFITGAQWGRYRGTLAVCALAGERLVFMRFGDDNRLLWTAIPAELRGTYNRLRSAVQTPSGALLVTTANGAGKDVVLRVTPTPAS